MIQKPDVYIWRVNSDLQNKVITKKDVYIFV